MCYFYQVAPTMVVRANEKFFTYHSDTPLKLGSLVRVSIGKSIKNGLLISELSEAPNFKTKPIETLLYNKALPAQLVGLAEWLSTYYATHLAIVLQTMLP